MKLWTTMLLVAGLCLPACSDDDSAANNNNDNENQNNTHQIRCGDGLEEGNEECDHGSANSDTAPNACRADCILPSCGDGVTDTGHDEECDDGAQNSDTEANACRADCSLPACSDGVTDDQYGEECDDGNLAAGDSCGPTCLFEACGNAHLDPGEECDDGNTTADDGCGPTCLLEACGNGYLDPGETCDDGAFNAYAPDFDCRPDCTPRRCGDGVRDSDEQCDHGGQNSDTEPDACRVACLVPFCGDSVRDASEVCDDGDNDDGDGCSADCLSDETCGNGVLDDVTNEACDAGDYNSMIPDAPCRPGCVLPDCGDGVIDALRGELCDDAGANSDSQQDACRTNCLPARCGDLVIDSTENCDDGDSDRGDGCGDTCHFEFGWNCQPTPPHNCVRCDPYLHGPACDRCAVLVNLESPTPTGDGSTWFTAFRTIQEGIDQAAEVIATNAAVDTCDVWVAEGTYFIYETDKTDTLSLASGVALYGGFAGNETDRDQRDWQNRRTILDGSDGNYLDNVFHVISLIDTMDATVDGFVITRARATGGGEHENGAGIYSSGSSLWLQNCVITDNAAVGSGSGVYAYQSDLAVTHTTFSKNTGASGAGLYVSTISASIHTVTITDATFIGNTSPDGDGGALFARSRADADLTLEISDTRFLGNTSGFNGGGAYCASDGGLLNASLTDVIFADNEADEAGGLNASASQEGTISVDLTDVIFSGNRAGQAGGMLNRAVQTGSQLTTTAHRTLFTGNSAYYSAGLHNTAIAEADVSVTLSNTVVAGNGSGYDGGGLTSIADQSDGLYTAVINSTFAGNDAPYDGGGMLYRVPTTGTCTAEVTGSILWDNSTSIDTENTTPSVTYSVVEGGYAGTGNTGENPLLTAIPGAPMYAGDWEIIHYDPATGQTELTDTTGGFPDGELVGLYVNPMFGRDPRWFLIAGNTTQTLRVWGDLRSVLEYPPVHVFPYITPFEPGDTYEVYDLRLQTDSPAIDSSNGCTGATCDPMIPIQDFLGNARHDTSHLDLYDCGGVSEPDCFSYVDMGAYEYLGPDPAPYAHTIQIDGTNDFNGYEVFNTSSAGYVAYISWDETYLYLGMEGTDVEANDPNKWFVAYVGGIAGHTTGVQYGGQEPALPFPSGFHIQWRTDNGWSRLREWDGGEWTDAGWPTGADAFHQGNFVELRMPWVQIGPFSHMYLHLAMINETVGSEWTWAAVPAGSFADGFDPDYTQYYEFDLSAPNPPSEHPTMP